MTELTTTAADLQMHLAELEQRLGLPLHPVGTVVPKGESPLLIYDGDIPRAFPDQSYDHFECP